MSPRSRRILAALVLLLLGLVALFLIQCTGMAAPEVRPTPAPVSSPEAPAPALESAAAIPAEPAPADPAPRAEPAAEVLTPARLQAPAKVAAGAAFRVEWEGPDNPGDYLTIVPPEAADAVYDNYVETRAGSPLEITAPLDTGKFELRYVALRSKTVLGRAPLEITPVEVTLSAPDEAVLGNMLPVSWTGPDNANDYLTIVPKGTPDGRYGNYTETRHGSPLEIRVPPEAGEAELRYISGQGSKVLGRRPLKIVAPETSVTGPEEVVAGTVFTASWVGPNNHGDYLTIVPTGTPDGQYRNYSETSKGRELQLTALMEPGDAELRYMTGQGARVLARAPIRIVPAKITLEAPAEAVAASAVPITWTGPNNRGDYLTIVRAGTPDGQYARYGDTSRGSPLSVEAPIDAGPAEIRYMSGQGARVLARRILMVTVPQVTLRAPPNAPAGSLVPVEWTGPQNRGDYLTLVAKSAKDGAAHQTVLLNRGSPAQVRAPKEPGEAEVRYMSGQGNRVLARTGIELTASP